MRAGSKWSCTKPVNDNWIEGDLYNSLSMTAGYDVVADFWTGLVAPAGTPPAIVAKLNAEINKVLATPELRNAILTLSAQPKGGTSEAFAKLIAAEVPKWRA